MIHMLKHTRYVLGVFAVLAFLCGTQILAQTISGTIYGTVTDQSGAVIPNAAITVTNVQTGIVHTARSNGTGNYIFPALSPGSYTVSVQIAGFRSETQTGVQLAVTQNVNVSFSLRPGVANQSVTVTAATTLVDTRESQLGTTVDQKRIIDLPLNGRKAYDLVQIVPGVTDYSANSAIGNNFGTTFSTNGNRKNMNTFYLDGAFDIAIFRGGGGNLIPNPDALEQFRMLTSNFDAEFGRSPGGVVNLVTRSGTNQYHGLAYDYLRNDALDAKNYFIKEVTPLKQNQFGGNFGGPIKRDKAFFFISYEGLRIRTPDIVPSTLITLTPAEAKGDFSAPTIKPTPVLPAGTNCGTKTAPVICPAALDPVAQNLLKYVPLENPITLQPPEQIGQANTNADQGLARVDYQLAKQHELSVMFFTTQGTIRNPTQAGNEILDFSGASTYGSQTNAVVSDRWIVSPNAVNGLHLFYSLNHMIDSPLFHASWSDWGSQVKQGSVLTDQPQFDIRGYWSMGMGDFGGNINQAQQTIGALDTFNWTHGNHTAKFGGSFLWSKFDQTSVNNGSGAAIFTGSATKNALADFLLGKVAIFNQSSGSIVRLHAPDPALFAQDDWRANHRLTLDLGLRWELFPPFTGQNDLGTFDPYVRSRRFPTAPLGLLSTGDPGVPDGVLHTSWNKFAPRVGFAYDVYGDGKTALHGAYGIFYAVNQVTFTDNLEQQPFLLAVQTNNTPNLVTPYAPGPDPFPYVVNPQNPRFTSGATLFALPPGDSTIPYVQEYNLAVQQQLGTQWAAQLAYVGSVSREMYLARDENSPVYIPGASITTAGLNARRPYQPTPTTYTFGQIDEYDPANSAEYNSLQLSVQRRFAHRFSLLTSYVWSKTMDNVSIDPTSPGPQLVNENNPAYDWGLSTLDIPQRFVASYLWVAPEVRHWGRVGKQVLSGWQINGITTLQSGSPFNVTSGVDTNRDGVNNDRPNQVGNPVLSGNRSRVVKIHEFFNTSAFAQLPPDTPYGDVKRNSLIGPGYINTDFSAFKIFSLPKESTLQFRGEIFNLFNNVNFSNPIGVMTSPRFGQITSSGSPRIVQFALRYAF